MCKVGGFPFDFFISQHKKGGLQHLGIETGYRFRYTGSIRFVKEVGACT